MFCKNTPPPILFSISIFLYFNYLNKKNYLNYINIFTFMHLADIYILITKKHVK